MEKWEKITRQWDKKLPGTGFKIARKGRSKGTVISKLAFADDIALLAKSTEEAPKQIETLQERKKLDCKYLMKILSISTAPNNREREILTKYGRIGKVNEFRYLGENISKTRTRSNKR